MVGDRRRVAVGARRAGDLRVRSDAREPVAMTRGLAPRRPVGRGGRPDRVHPAGREAGSESVGRRRTHATRTMGAARTADRSRQTAVPRALRVRRDERPAVHRELSRSAVADDPTPVPPVAGRGGVQAAGPWPGSRSAADPDRLAGLSDRRRPDRAAWQNRPVGSHARRGGPDHVHSLRPDPGATAARYPVHHPIRGPDRHPDRRGRDGPTALVCRRGAAGQPWTASPARRQR